MYAAHDAQVGLNPSSTVPTSAASSSATGSQDYGQPYPGYPSTADNYAYGNPNYQGYNYDYNQQDSTPYQGTATYFNAAGYQSTGPYQHNSYSGHSGQWVENSYGNYGAYSGYPGYGSLESSGTLNSTQFPSSQYAPDYQQQWANYYASFQNGLQADFDDTTAPGTEPATVAILETDNSSNSQPPPPGTQPAWELNTTGYSEAAGYQAVPTAPMDNGGAVWGNAHMGAVHGDQYPQLQSCHFQHVPYLQQSLQEQSPQYQLPPDQHTVMQQGQHAQTLPSCLAASNFQSNSLQSVNAEPPQRRVGKLQIPTNPRIAPTLAVTSKATSTDSAQAPKAVHKPAYISVAGKAPGSKASSDAAAEAMLQPGMFPPSLRAYVERALSRCKDETQKKTCQEIMKEMITTASSDRSLFTKDWDTEPLFPLPSVVSTSENEGVQGLIMTSSLSKLDRSPPRRSKSRWEPVVEERLSEKMDASRIDATKDGVWSHIKGAETSVSSVKWDKQDGVWNKTKLLLQQQLLNAKKTKRPLKKAKKDPAGESQEGNNSSEESEDEVVLGGGVYLGTLGAVETPEEKMKRQSRTKRFDNSKETNASSKGAMKGRMGIGGASARRATALLLAKSYGDAVGGAVEDINWDALTVKGTCQEIEKRFLRLTSAPDPSTVRPEEVLKKALAMVQTTQKNYLYKCEQLKSIRQDLTVQRIKDELTVQVYETHARMALEEGDLPEYNQCQSQLKGLYAEGIRGCNNEFTAYNLLYIIFQHGNNRDLLFSMARLSREAKEDEAIKHALAVRAAVAAGNYIAFFRLYRTAPNLGTCLMDLYVERMRFEALRCMSRAYRPILPVSFIGRTLGFIGLGSSETGCERDLEGLDDCEEWLRAHGAHLMNENTGEESNMDCKASSTGLFMPEPEDAVAHGDANLAVNDFLAQV